MINKFTLHLIACLPMLAQTQSVSWDSDHIGKGLEHNLAFSGGRYGQLSSEEKIKETRWSAGSTSVFDGEYFGYRDFPARVISNNRFKLDGVGFNAAAIATSHPSDCSLERYQIIDKPLLDVVLNRSDKMSELVVLQHNQTKEAVVYQHAFTVSLELVDMTAAWFGVSLESLKSKTRTEYTTV